MSSTTSAFWDHINVASITLNPTCDNPDCKDAATKVERPPEGAPDVIEEVIVCANCEKVLDAN